MANKECVLIAIDKGTKVSCGKADTRQSKDHAARFACLQRQSDNLPGPSRSGSGKNS